MGAFIKYFMENECTPRANIMHTNSKLMNTNVNLMHIAHKCTTHANQVYWQFWGVFSEIGSLFGKWLLNHFHFIENQCTFHTKGIHFLEESV